MDKKLGSEKIHSKELKMEDFIQMTVIDFEKLLVTIRRVIKMKAYHSGKLFHCLKG